MYLPYPKLKTEITNQKNKPACVGLSHVPSRSSNHGLGIEQGVEGGKEQKATLRV